MRAAIWILLLFALAVAVTLLARADQGYVLLVYPPWRVEMSFALALGLAILLFAIAYVLLRVLRTALMLPADMKAWRDRKRTVRAEETLTRAVAALLGGQPAHARQLAGRVLEQGPHPMASLVAAYAALALDDRAAAESCLADVQGGHGEIVAARQHLQERLRGGAAAGHADAPAAAR